MGKTPAKVQTSETTSHQDITHSDESLDDLRAILFPDHANLYNGPGAYTMREMANVLGLGRTQTRSRLEKAVTRGEMTKVRVKRENSNGGEYVTTAWVTRAAYDQWMENNDGHERS